MSQRSRMRTSDLHFSKLSQKKLLGKRRKFLDIHLNLKLSPKLAYSINFMDREFILAFSEEFANGGLLQSVTAKEGILGIIMARDDASKGYLTDKIVVTRPTSSRRIAIEILSLQGESLYSGIGHVRRSGIDFAIRGGPSEGRVRTAISGTIGRSGVAFKKSIMPNRIYKKPRSPIPSKKPP